MKILITNDDGYDAIGIQALYKAFKDEYDSYMCAPLKHKSAFGHAIYYADYLELKTLTGDVKGYAIDGTPADCPRAALQGLFSEKFDLVLSGINYGVNASQDIFYSGTVGAARESSFHGLMAIALSLDIEEHKQTATEEIQKLFTYCAEISKRIVKQLPKELLDYKGSIININFPSQLPAKGIKLTSVGTQKMITDLPRKTEGDKEYMWIHSFDKKVLSGEGTDIYELKQGYIVVTALTNGVVLDETLQSKLSFIKDISVDI